MKLKASSPVRICQHSPLPSEMPFGVVPAPCYDCATLMRGTYTDTPGFTGGLFASMSKPMTLASATAVKHLAAYAFNKGIAVIIDRRTRLSNFISVSA